jgi:selenocysteine lyase/cysteine desulfurase
MSEVPMVRAASGDALSNSEQAFAELEAGVGAALTTYANVHRGTGLFSTVSTEIYEEARRVILQHMGLSRKEYTLIFGTPHSASVLKAHFPADATILSSRELGLPLGLVAMGVRTKTLPPGAPPLTGGGTTKIISRATTVWDTPPDRFEAGTPPVMNVIAMAVALRIASRRGGDVFKTRPAATATGSPLHDDLQATGKALLDHLRQTMIGQGTQIPMADGQAKFVNLDNAASTPSLAPVWNAVRQTWRLSNEAQPPLVAQVRDICARFFHAPADRYEMFFTSNTTEAINVVARCLARTKDTESESVVLNTLLEHNSDELPWRYTAGRSVVRIPVDQEGIFDVGRLEAALQAYNRDQRFGNKRIRIVAVSGASNVLGTCHDLQPIGELAHRYGAQLLVDAAQLAAHRKVDMEAAGIDYLAFSGHKMYAPFGTGGLMVRKGLLGFSEEELQQLRASGDENVVGIVALGKAMDLLMRVGMDVVQEEEQALTRKALLALAEVPNIEVFGISNPDSPRFAQKGGVISFRVRNLPHNVAAERLAEFGGIGVRNGCFCAHLVVKWMLQMPPGRERLANDLSIVFPVLGKNMLPGMVRASFGLENDEEDIARLASTLRKITAQGTWFINRLLAWTENATTFVPPFVPLSPTRRRMAAFSDAALASVFEPGKARPEPSLQATTGEQLAVISRFVGMFALGTLILLAFFFYAWVPWLLGYRNRLKDVGEVLRPDCPNPRPQEIKPRS